MSTHSAKKTIAIITVASSVLLALAACSSTNQAGSKQPIKLGVVGDQTGVIADGFGGRNPQVDGINAAIDLLNSQGGINGRKITTDLCDTQSNASRGPICAQQFITDRVTSIVGFSQEWSPTGIAATDKAQIPNFTYPNTNQEVDNKYSFPMLGGGVNSYPAQAKYLTADKKLKNAAVFYIDAPIGASLAAIYQKALKRFGATKVTLIAVPLTASDMSTYVTAAQKAGAQAIYGVAEASSMVLAIKAANQLGYDPAWSLGDAAVEKSQISQPLGALANGVYGSSATIEWTSPNNAQTKTFLDAMKKYVPGAPIYQNTADGFATVMTLASALEKYKGDLTGPALQKYFEKLSGIPVFMGGGAELDASKAPAEHPHDLNPSYNIVQWQNGKTVIVKTDVNGWVK